MIDDALNSLLDRRSLGLFDDFWDGFWDGLYDDERSRTAHCANVCAGVAAGTCWKKGCKNFRNLRNTDRDLLTCDTEINSIHAKLDEVRNKVTTASCKLFLQKDRRISKCYPDHVYGKIEGMRVWNWTSIEERVPNDPVLPGGSCTVCQNQRLAFESLNEPCVQNGTLSLLGPNGYNKTKLEKTLPLTLFGNNGVRFHVERLNMTGTYTLRITPNGLVDKTKKFTVNVVDCPEY